MAEEKMPDEYTCSSRNLVDVVIARHKDFQIDLKMVQEAHESDPEESFLMEWLGVFPDDTAGFFSNQLLDKCVPRGIREIVPIEVTGDEDFDYVMGVDPARSEKGDLFAYVILKIISPEVRQVVKVVTARGMTFPDMADSIRKEMFVYGFKLRGIWMDLRGGGKEIADLLAKPGVINNKPTPIIITEEDLASGRYDEKESRAILHMVDFSPQMINELYFGLKADMERQMVLFPIDIRRDADLNIQTIGQEIIALKNEMRVLQTTATSHGLKFEAPTKFTKDRITALTLANYGARQIAEESEGKSLLENLLDMGGWI